MARRSDAEKAGVAGHPAIWRARKVPNVLIRTRRGRVRMASLPPGPRGLPLVGMLPAIRRDPTGVFMDAARRFGDVAYFKIGPRRGFLITGPADIRHVLQDNARNYHKSPLYNKLRLSLGNGLLTSEGDFWLRQRRIAQ